MTSYAGFASTAHDSSVSISTAETSRTAPTNAGVVFTAGASGSRIDSVQIVPAGTVTAGMIRLYLYNGSSYFLLVELPVQANTPSATNPVSRMVLATGVNIELPIILQSGHSLRAGTHNAETFHVTAFGGDY